MLPTAGTLAATGDVIAGIALVVAVIALVALVALIVAKKARRRKEPEWRYPF